MIIKTKIFTTILLIAFLGAFTTAEKGTRNGKTGIKRGKSKRRSWGKVTDAE